MPGSTSDRLLGLTLVEHLNLLNSLRHERASRLLLMFDPVF
jgi:hypothetical protein